jgi:integrase
MRTHGKTKLDRGIGIYKGTVYVRIFAKGRPIKVSIGKVTDPGVISTARAELAKLREAKRLNKLGLEGKEHRIPFEEAANLFLEKHGNAWASNMPPLKEFFGRFWLDEITYLQCKNYRDWRSQKTTKWHGVEAPIKQNSIAKELRCLSSLYNHLKVWKEAKDIGPIKMQGVNPVFIYRKMVGLRNENLDRRTRLVTPAELKEFYLLATSRVKRAIIMALNTALRKKDLFELDTSKRDDYSNRLRGVQNKVLSEYVLPNNPVVDKLLGSGSLDKTNFRREWDAAMDAFVKLGHERFQFRDCRRTAAIKVWDVTKDIRLCQALLGHSSQTTTETYLGIKREDLDKAGETLAKAFPIPQADLEVIG